MTSIREWFKGKPSEPVKYRLVISPWMDQFADMLPAKDSIEVQRWEYNSYDKEWAWKTVEQFDSNNEKHYKAYVERRFITDELITEATRTGKLPAVWLDKPGTRVVDFEL